MSRRKSPQYKNKKNSGQDISARLIYVRWAGNKTKIKTGHGLNQINRMRFDFVDMFWKTVRISVSDWMPFIISFGKFRLPLFVPGKDLQLKLERAFWTCAAFNDAVFGADNAQAFADNERWKTKKKKHKQIAYRMKRRSESNIFHFLMPQRPVAMNQMRCQTNDIYTYNTTWEDAKVVYCFAGFLVVSKTQAKR